MQGRIFLVEKEKGSKISFDLPLLVGTTLCQLVEMHDKYITVKDLTNNQIVTSHRRIFLMCAKIETMNAENSIQLIHPDYWEKAYKLLPRINNQIIFPISRQNIDLIKQTRKLYFSVQDELLIPSINPLKKTYAPPALPPVTRLMLTCDSE